MASTLILPEGLAPSNLHLAPSTKQRWVEGDVFMIADRLRREVDANLHIIELEDAKDGVHWLVMEHCADGVERRVLKADALDARLIERCQYLLHVPFDVRYRAIEAENDRWEAEQADLELEKMYDSFGGQMWVDLERCGFVQRGVSYPKRGVKPAAG